VLDQLEKVIIENLVDLGKLSFHLDRGLFDDCPEEWIRLISVSEHCC